MRGISKWNKAVIGTCECKLDRIVLDLEIYIGNYKILNFVTMCHGESVACDNRCDIRGRLNTYLPNQIEIITFDGWCHSWNQSQQELFTESPIRINLMAFLEKI